MRKVLGVLVRSPQTVVEIDPPSKGIDSKITPEDAILRALYSYNSPEDYLNQASWLKLKKADGGLVELLTKKRYRIYLPSMGKSTNYVPNEGGGLEVTVKPTNINLSNLEAGVGLAIASYPLSYALFTYERQKEEEAAALKKAQMKKKKEMAEAAKKKKAAVEAKKKADAAKIPSTTAEQQQKSEFLPSNIVQNEQEDTLSTITTVEDEVAQEMIDSQRKEFISSTTAGQQQKLEFLPSNIVQNEQEDTYAQQQEQQLSGDSNNQESSYSEQSSQTTTTGGGYLDNLTPQASQDTTNYNGGPNPNTYRGTSLRSLVQDLKPKRGPQSYLDSL